MPFPDPSDRPLEELTSLRGRGAVVTGGARGLGAATARRLAEAGAAVLIGDIDLPEAQARADELRALYGTAVDACRLDVTDPASVASAIERATNSIGGVDIWVNNAGVYPSTSFTEMTDEDWDRVLGINLRGAFLGCRSAARYMTERGRGGVIVNVASVAGVGGRGPGVAHYVASKHGVIGLTKQLALELASADIRVLAVAPSIIQTPGVEAAVGPRAAEAGVSVEEMLAGPGGRAGVPDDVARVVLFCVSDMAAFMTGTAVLIDAGDTAR